MYYQTRNPHGGDIYAEKVELDYSANTNPLGVPPAVIAAAAASLERADRYPDPYCRAAYPWGAEDTDLREAFRGIMTRRMGSVAMRTGTMKLHAVGADVVMVERRVNNGRDAFDRPAKDEVRVLAVNRSGEHRWVEFQGHGYEIPGESALLLDLPDPAPAARRRVRIKNVNLGD